MQPQPTSRPPPRPLAYILLFLACVLLGQSARSLESVALADAQCQLGAGGDLVEVRRIEGSGDIEAQRGSWHEHIFLVTDNDPGMVLTDSTLPLEDYSLQAVSVELETGP